MTPTSSGAPAPQSPDSHFTATLLAWYSRNARPLPWRKTTDPYAIWVSEVMLQQTRVETVIPYYSRFLERFPTLAALAAASEEELLKTWEGLGYYRRVRLLQQGAQEVLTRYGGMLPSDPEALGALPGVGPYMAGALASIAFNLPVPAVDGNVTRVVTRVLAWNEPATTAHSRQVIRTWVAERFPDGAAREFTQALMELGALVCLPRKPCCRECPVQDECCSRKSNPELFPVKKAVRTVPSERRIVLRIDWNGKRLLIQRPSSGLLSGFWEYPNLPAETGVDAITFARRWTEEHLGLGLSFILFKTLVQIFTHRRWELEVLTARWPVAQEPPELPSGRWFSDEEAAELPCVTYLRHLEGRSPLRTSNKKVNTKLSGD